MRPLADIADSHGLITASKATSIRTLQRWHSEGRVAQLLPGVFCLPQCAQAPVTLLHAVPLWSPLAVVTGMAAARALFWPEAAGLPVDLLARSRRRNDTYRMHRQAAPPEHVVTLDGVPFTSPAWTAVWLAAWDDGAALDVAMRNGLTGQTMLDTLATMKGTTANARRTEIVRWSQLRPWSQFERAAQRVLVDAGITGWQGNWPYRSRSGKLYVLDIAFIAQRVAIEVDGYGVHGTREAWRRDMHKTNDLILDGWLVLHFSWADLADPAHMVDQIRRALRSAA